MSRNIEELRDMLRYNAGTGLLFWKTRPLSSFTTEHAGKVWNSRFVGAEAGSIHVDGYRRVEIDRRKFLSHRIIWALVYGVWPEGFIDHIDHNRTNNKITNLRVVTRAENNRNASLRSDNTSGAVGVRWHKNSNKWESRISVGGRLHYLGLFTKFDDAVSARKLADQEIGYHENHGG